MWSVAVVCSACAEESELVVEDLDQVEREVCSCGHGFAILAVAAFEPVYAERGELVELPRRRQLSRAA